MRAVAASMEPASIYKKAGANSFAQETPWLGYAELCPDKSGPCMLAGHKLVDSYREAVRTLRQFY